MTGLGLGVGSGPLSAMAVGNVAGPRGMAAAGGLITWPASARGRSGWMLARATPAAGGGQHGLLLSMIAGSLVQFAGAGIAWIGTTAAAAGSH